jgi:hypothetical protein
MNAPALLAADTQAKPHPIDAAIAALSDHVTSLLASASPNRFGEIQIVTKLALQLQRLRPGADVDAMGMFDDDDEDGPFVRRIRHGALRRPFNDAADISTQTMMLAQNFLDKYAEIEKLKATKPDLDIRLGYVSELAELFSLRWQMKEKSESVPSEIEERVTALLKRIGEPSHEPNQHGSDPALPAEPVRGRETDGAGQPDGGGVGEPVAERAPGDGGPGEEVRPDLPR